MYETSLGFRAFISNAKNHGTGYVQPYAICRLKSKTTCWT